MKHIILFFAILTSFCAAAQPTGKVNTAAVGLTEMEVHAQAIRKAVLAHHTDSLRQYVDLNSVDGLLITTGFEEPECVVLLFTRLPEDALLEQRGGILKSTDAVSDMLFTTKRNTGEKAILQGNYVLRSTAKKLVTRPFIIYLHFVEGQWKVY